MSLIYYCDKCKKETNGHVVQPKNDFCPKCAKEYQKWLTKGEED